MSSINNLLLGAFHIEKCVAIDESTIPHKGRFGALVYNKSKPNKWGIKLYALCSSETGYCYKVKLYTGKTTAVDKLIEKLTDPKRNGPYKLYLDNFYTTINNVTQCAAGKIFRTGTCRINRRELPKDLIKLASKQLQKNQMILVNNDQINLILLQDKKFVIILFTVNYVAPEEYVNTGKKLFVERVSYEVLENNTKVKFIDEYNSNMGSVDLLDQKISYYDCNRKSNRLTFKLSFFILNMFACNLHVIYTHQKLGNKNCIAFNLYLCDYLCNMYREDNRRSDNTDVTISQGDGVQDLTNTFSSNTNLDSSFLRAKSGKQSKTNIKMFKAGDWSIY
ncbi:PiggyBac transposable element-derived protein 4 [Cucumispora dikerogammari]|nr:PiggyBac transposable element-derived protein 4 [Cucumispora dikerogammari]